jgi:predicted Zn-dependent peptidase
VIAGDIDTRQARTLVNQMFGDLPPVAPQPEKAVDTKLRPDPARLHFEAQGDNAALVAAWLMPPESSKEYVTAQVALQKLANIAYGTARHDELIDDISVDFRPRRFASVGVIVMQAKKDVDADRLLDALADASSDFDDYKRDGWVGDARSHCIIGQIFDMTSNADRAERIALLSTYGRSAQVQDELQQCMQIEAGPVKAWGSDYFTPAHAVLAFVRHADSAPPAGREVAK